VNVDGPDALAANLDGQARGLGLGAGRIQHAAATEADSARRRALQKIPAGSH
jgi:hypothetical protein